MPHSLSSCHLAEPLNVQLEGQREVRPEDCFWNKCALLFSGSLRVVGGTSGEMGAAPSCGGEGQKWLSVISRLNLFFKF